MRLFSKTVSPTGKTHSATVIFFHGSGDTGPNLLEWVRFLLGRDMEFSHVKVVYPTAPKQPYTPLKGQESNVWFDRRAISIEAKEARISLAQIYESVHTLINDELQQGIPANRIIVGGFSMGGALAMHIAYHLNTDLAGVFACSSFLNRKSIVYESLQNTSKQPVELPELLMFHGDQDAVVPIDWAKETFKELKELGVTATFSTLNNAFHELKKRELLDICDWISTKLSPLSSDLHNKL